MVILSVKDVSWTSKIDFHKITETDAREMKSMTDYEIIQIITLNFILKLTFSL